MAGTGPLFVQVGPPKIAISRGFTTYFKTTGLQLKLLVLIESPNIFHGKTKKKNKVGVVMGKNLSQITGFII